MSIGKQGIEEEAAAAAGGLGVFGDGSDGDIAISGDTDLVRDMFYNNLTINETFTLSTKGFRICVKDTLTNNGTIENNGGDAADTLAGVGAAAGTLGGGGDGSITGAHGSFGGGGGGGGIIVIRAKTIINTSGTIQANGGDGFTPTLVSVGEANGAAVDPVNSGMGGNGGKGGDAGDATGATGGVVTITKAPIRTSDNWSAYDWTIPSLVEGGAGGGCGGSDTDPEGGGGGGGGGGGAVILFYNSLTTGTEEAAGGTGAAGKDAGDAGANGSAGAVVKIDCG